MLRQLRKVLGYKLGAVDGDIGKARDFYFDDHAWTIRYLVADTGTWLTGKQVLISPVSMKKLDDEYRIVQVDLTKQQVEASPPISMDEPVSRRMEAEHAQYYGWPMYWYGPSLWGPEPFPIILQPAENLPPQPRMPPAEQPDQTHLRSVLAVTGYHIRARDGEIGHVEDFLFDDQNWAIRYMEISTRNWWPGKKVLIPPNWIEKLDWDTASVQISLERACLQNAPAYDPHAAVTRQYEEQLYAYYKREGYWPQPR